MTVARPRAIAAAVVAAGILATIGGGAAISQGATRSGAQTTSGSRPSFDVNTCTLLKQTCFSPQTLQTAYGASSLITRGTDGSGETVVIVDSAAPASAKTGSVSLAQSLSAYDSRYHLPGPKLSVSTKFAPGASQDAVSPKSDGQEIVLDLEMVHAMAPGAALQLDLYKGTPTGSLPSILRYAAGQGQVVSLSFGVGERCFAQNASALQSALAYDQQRHVSVFAAAGDDGAASRTCKGVTTNFQGITLPGSDPLITSVGGTALTVDPGTGAYRSEVVWNAAQNGKAAGNPLGGKTTASGTGGGFSRIFPRPSYQDGVPGTEQMRGLPDVAFDASESTPESVVGVIDGAKPCAAIAKLEQKLKEKLHEGSGAISPSSPCEVDLGVGGTSAGSPAWAGIAALADQMAGRGLGFLNPSIYKIGQSSAYGQAFHDVTSGDNSVTVKGTQIKGYSATKGWDPVTGWGTPNASALVPLLVKESGGTR